MRCLVGHAVLIGVGIIALGMSGRWALKALASTVSKSIPGFKSGQCGLNESHVKYCIQHACFCKHMMDAVV